MATEKINIQILSPEGKVKWTIDCYYAEESRFYIPIRSMEEYQSINSSVDRFDYVSHADASGKIIKRPIIGLSVVRSLLDVTLCILAPLQVSKKRGNVKYIQQNGIEFRPGTKIIGGRNSGFYDDEGIIIDATYIGGSEEKFEDWAYYVIGKSDFGKDAPQWILLNDIGFPIEPPSLVLDLHCPESSIIEEYFKDAQEEMLEYLAAHPKAIESLNGLQLENLVNRIYTNLGFDVENVGNWNQADGGVDILAVSRTVAETEFRVAIQCKSSKNKISAKPIRELSGVLEKFKAHQGIVVTTSLFTGPARKEAEGYMWKISLQDRDDLIRRIISLIRPELREHIKQFERVKSKERNKS